MIFSLIEIPPETKRSRAFSRSGIVYASVNQAFFKEARNRSGP
jgi:hypothetical protein